MEGGAMGAAAAVLPKSNPRASTAGFPLPSSSSSCSSLNPNPNFPASAGYSSSLRTRPPVSYTTSQVSVNGEGAGARGGGFGSSGSSIFGLVPSQHEVERAIAALQYFLQGISSSGSDTNWFQLLGICDPRLLLSAGLRRVTHALCLLQTDPSVKRLVISLACDRALWEAILNNRSVRKLWESHSAENGRHGISGEALIEPESGSDNLMWFLDIVKEKIFDLIEKFKSLVNEIFLQYTHSMEKPTAETAAHLEEKLSSSLLLYVVILLIVILARVHGA